MSNIHEGVSCDACMKNNFQGRRYKCLVCYDFDLCSLCYESGVFNSQHLNTHPMQCILTKADYNLYYGGETQVEPQSFTCPYCGKLGFTELTLSEHVTIEHEDDNYEVVCPICAAIPTGDPNHLTEDLLNHINLEHRQARESTNMGANENEDSAIRFSRRLNSRTLTSRRGGGSGGGGGGGGVGGGGSSSAGVVAGSGSGSSSAGRGGFQFGNTSAFSFGGSSLIGRDCMDPIAELLSQLSGVRRAAASAQSSSIHLQQLQAQLTREREHLQQSRQALFGRAPVSTSGVSSTTTTNASSSASAYSNKQQQQQQQLPNSTNNNNTNSLATTTSASAINPLTNQILELPTIFQSINMTKDSRFLLSKYDSNSMVDNTQTTKENNITATPTTTNTTTTATNHTQQNKRTF